MANARPPSGVALFGDIAQRIVSRLPGSWASATDVGTADGGRAPAVAWMTLTPPAGPELRLAMVVMPMLSPREVPAAVEMARGQAERSDGVAVVGARYLSEPVRDALVRAGVGYADATGNMWVTADRPAVHIRDVGAGRDPWRGAGRPRGSLKGPTAARLIRALVDSTPPFSIPQLVRRSGVSVGAAYRMVDHLEREALIERTPRGPIVRVDWRTLLERWADDYRDKAPPLGGYLEPRTLGSLLERLPGVDHPSYVVTASSAVGYVTELFAPLTVVTLLTDDPSALARELSLRPIDAGANVLIGAPIDRDAVFSGARTVGGVSVAACSQIAIDLLVAPGRGPSEAQMLMDWMEANLDAWQT